LAPTSSALSLFPLQALPSSNDGVNAK
jgi:hypothetical protein